MKVLTQTFCLIIIAAGCISLIGFGQWLSSNHLHKIYKDQQNTIAILEQENRDISLAKLAVETEIMSRFAVCENVLEGLGLQENYRMAMGGYE